MVLSDLFGFIFNRPDISLGVAGIWLFGYVTLSIMQKWKQEWGKIKGLDKAIAAAALGLATAAFIVVPFIILFSILSGLSITLRWQFVLQDLQPLILLAGIWLLIGVPFVLPYSRYRYPWHILDKFSAFLDATVYSAAAGFGGLGIISYLLGGYPPYITSILYSILSNKLELIAFEGIDRLWTCSTRLDDDQLLLYRSIER